MFGEKMARKRPKRDWIGFTATGLGLEQDPRMYDTRVRVHTGGCVLDLLLNNENDIM